MPAQYLAELQQMYVAQRMLLLEADVLKRMLGSSLFDTASFRALKRLRGAPDASAEQLLEWAAEIEAENFKRRHRTILERAAPVFQEILAKLEPLAVGELDIAQFHASAIAVPEGRGVVLAFRKGMSLLTYWFGRLLAACADFGVEHDRPADPSWGTAMLEDTILWYHRIGVIDTLDFRLSERRIQLAAEAVESALVFVHCHELAHVMLGHVRNGERRMLPSDNARAEEVIAESHDEYAADQLALELMISMKQDENPTHEWMSWVWAGIWMFFRFACILEQLHTDYQGTHPPANNRLLRLRGAAKIECEKRGYPPEVLYGASFYLSRSYNSIVKNLSLSRVVKAPSPIDSAIRECLPKEDGLLEFRARLLYWIGSTALPRRFCDEVGLVRAQAIRATLPRHERVRAFDSLELVEAYEAEQDRTTKEALLRLVALDCNPRLSADASTPLDHWFEEYTQRVEFSTERALAQ